MTHCQAEKSRKAYTILQGMVKHLDADGLDDLQTYMARRMVEQLPGSALNQIASDFRDEDAVPSTAAHAAPTQAAGCSAGPLGMEGLGSHMGPAAAAQIAAAPTVSAGGTVTIVPPDAVQSGNRIASFPVSTPAGTGIGSHPVASTSMSATPSGAEKAPLGFDVVVHMLPNLWAEADVHKALQEVGFEAGSDYDTIVSIPAQSLAVVRFLCKSGANAFCKLLRPKNAHSFRGSFPSTSMAVASTAGEYLQ